MKISRTLTYCSIAFVAAAAVLWFLSARVKTPDGFAVHIVLPEMGPAGGAVGGTYVGHAYSNDFQALASALRRQSVLSAWAASAAAVSVALQSAASWVAP